jgi:transketolase
MKESLYQEADFRAMEGEASAMRFKAEVADLTKVLGGKSKELEDVIAEHQVKLATALQERDMARSATTTMKKQLAALEKKHAEEVATREASESTLLVVQKENTDFEAFVREMS